MMTTLTKSLQRLYQAGRLTKDQIKERVEKRTITKADYQEITGEVYEDGVDHQPT